MTEFPTLSIQVASEDPTLVCLSLYGKVSGAALGELRREIERARRMHKGIVIDLSEVTLLDRHGLEFLVTQRRDNVRLENAPVYLERWIAREA
jgi:anti-anti-sigma regulatory factor